MSDDEESGEASESKLRFGVRSVQRRGGPVARWLRRWGVGLGAALPLGLWTAIVFQFASGQPPPEAAIVALIASSWLGPAAALAARLLDGRKVRADVAEVEHGQLTLRAEGEPVRTVARSEVKQGIYLFPKDDASGSVTSLQLASGEELAIELDDTRARDGGLALQLLDALGIGAADRRAVFEWRRTFDTLLVGIGGIAALLGLFFLVPSKALLVLVCPILSGLPWLLAWFLGKTAARRRIEIGADGLRAQGRLRTVIARFADLKDVRRVNVQVGKRGQGIVQHLLELSFHDGRTERVLLDPDDEGIAVAVVARLNEARDAAASGRGSAHFAGMLERAGHSFESLREAAEALLNSAVGFRDGAVTEAEVESLLRDPNATAQQRIAAAIALRAQEWPDGKERIQEIAESVARPRLRVALDAAATGELDEAAWAEAREEERAVTGPRKRSPPKT